MDLIKYPLTKQNLYKNTWERLQKETHFSNTNMVRNFPDLYKAKEEERRINTAIEISRLIRTIMNDMKGGK